MTAPNFSFSIPSLPKQFYEFVQEFRRKYRLSPWQVVIVALKALHELHTSDPGGVSVLTRMVEDIRERFPSHYIPPKVKPTL